MCLYLVVSSPNVGTSTIPQITLTKDSTRGLVDSVSLRNFPCVSKGVCKW